MTIVSSTRLEYSQGSSDKFYEVSVRQVAGGNYHVHVVYGRIGTAGNASNKTNDPLPYAAAVKLANKTLDEKRRKGYVDAGSGQNTTATSSAPRQAAVIGVQLLNPVKDEAQLEALLEDDNVVMQEKADGVRMRVLRSQGNFMGVNRRNIFTDLPQTTVTNLEAAFGHIKGSLDLDGELVGLTYHVFDALRLGDRHGDISKAAFEDRLNLLVDEIAPTPGITLMPAQSGTAAKRAFLEEMRKVNAEGVVLRDRRAAYTEGKPNSGGAALKFKFCESATVLVTAHNTQRSVAIAAMGANGKPVPVGNVTIPPSAPMPPLKSLIEVQYLYFYPSGSLFQPVLKAVRDDLEAADDLSSLKVKRASQEIGAEVLARTMPPSVLAGGATVAPVLF